MREETRDCLRPWDENDSQILSAAMRWGLRRRNAVGLTTRRVVHRARRDDEEIAFDAPEAGYVVTQALEQLMFEANYSDRPAATAKLGQAAGLYLECPSMPPALSVRTERVATRAVRKYGMAAQWHRALAVASGNKYGTGEGEGRHE